MKNYDVVIIGAGPAGIVTGVTVKKYFPEKKVLIITEEKKGLVPCGIPYIFNKLDNVDADSMGPKAFLDLGGDVVIDPVVSVSLNQKQLLGKSGNRYGYDKLVFATGSQPVEASFIKGHNLENVFYIKKVISISAIYMIG